MKPEEKEETEEQKEKKHKTFVERYEKQIKHFGEGFWGGFRELGEAFWGSPSLGTPPVVGAAGNPLAALKNRGFCVVFPFFPPR